jgi:hypothetical protein
MAMPDVRTGQGSVKLSRDEFSRRVRARFDDPIFDGVSRELDRVVDLAWKAYDEYHKSPRTRRAGPGFSDRISSCPSNGWRPANGSWRLSVSTKTSIVLRVSC